MIRQRQPADDELIDLETTHARSTDRQATNRDGADGQRADCHGAHCYRPEGIRGSQQLVAPVMAADIRERASATA